MLFILYSIWSHCISIHIVYYLQCIIYNVSFLTSQKKNIRKVGVMYTVNLNYIKIYFLILLFVERKKDGMLMIF